jgi:hypothetical protein
VNWDDDDNSEGDGGHGKLLFQNDFDSPASTEEENDLIKLEIHKIEREDTTVRLKYNDEKIRIWRNANRTQEVASQQSVFEASEDMYIYLEGKKITEAEKPEIITLEVKLPESTIYEETDSIAVHVATPIITFFGKHEWTAGQGSLNLAKKMHDKQQPGLGKNRRDDRNNTVIIKGKNQQGQTLWYSVDMVDITPLKEGDIISKRPLIKIRAPQLDKEMKMALSLEGAHVYYNGHSNFGLGPNFHVGGTTTVDDYMNLSGGGVTAIILKSDDPADPNPMAVTDHGGPDFALRPADIPAQVTNYTVPVSGVPKFTGPAVGVVLQKQTHADGTPYHYQRQGVHNNWITVVNSSGDVPTLRYASCFMASCNTGRHFPETLNHGVLLFSIDETYGVLGGLDGRLDADPKADIYSWGVTYYVRMLIEGKTWTEIVTFFNQNQYFTSPNTSPDNLHNYKFKTF